MQSKEKETTSLREPRRITCSLAGARRGRAERTTKREGWGWRGSEARYVCALSGGLYEHLGADVPVGATWGLTVVGPPDALVAVSLWSP